MQKTESKKNWAMTSNAFARLLEWLDEGKDSDGRNYLEMRQRLVAYFDRKNCLTPDELADETLNRVARRLEEEGTIKSETPAKYCYITAKFVFMESLRGADKKSVPLDDILKQPPSNKFAVREEDEEKKIKEKMLNCLEECTGKLETANREIIINYYYGEERVKIENRRALAEKLGISTNALTIRACRIRDKLEGCVGRCVGEN
jgi:DNA-directed RNA polymerase specialized sigma24 family protein